MEVINDLISDVKNIETEIKIEKEENATPKISTPEVSIEHFLNKFLISNETKEKLNNYISFKCSLEQYKNEKYISRKSALEVFTMIASIDKKDEMKLTVQPSSQNKVIFDNISSSLKNDIEKQITDEYDKVFNLYNTYIDFKNNKLNELLNFIRSFEEKNSDLLNNILNSETKKLIVYENNTINILETSLEDLARIDDTKLYFKPFENNFSRLIQQLLYHLNKEEIVLLLNKNKFSYLKDILVSSMNLSSVIENLMNELDKLGNFASLDEEAKIEKIYQLNKHIEILIAFNKLHSTLNDENNFFVTVEEIIKLLNFK